MNEVYIIYACIGSILILLGYCIYLHQRIKNMLRGNSSNIEESILVLNGELKNLHNFRKELEPYLTSVEKRLKRSIQGVHTIRFDPFKGDGSGGKQSFATALLNEDGNGVVISSLHSRDRMNVYSKPVNTFNSNFDLTEEEAMALSKAKESCTL